MEWHLEDVGKVVRSTKVCCGAQRVNNLQNKSQKFTNIDPGTTQPEGNFIHLYHNFIIFSTLKIIPVLVVNSLCKHIFLIFFSKFPVFSLSGKMYFQIPCFPCAVATPRAI